MTTERSSAEHPWVSVIVPVRNRRDLLADLLRGLHQQTFPDFEVLVVDDGSTDGADEVASKALVAGRRVRLLRSHGRGAVAARSLAVEAAVGQVLAFTDSDCVPQPGWLEAGVRAVDRGAAMVNGPTRPARRVGPLERSVSSATEGLYPTCNMFFRRDAFDAAGGFDTTVAEDLGFRPGRRAKALGFCEDTMLAWRVRREYPVAFAADAIVEHHVFTADATEWLHRSAMLGGFPKVIREVPELRATLMRGPVLFHQFTRLPLYILVLAGVSRRPRLAATSLSVWCILQLRDYRGSGSPWPTALKALPAKLAIDVVSCGSLVLGSAKARRLAL